MKTLLLSIHLIATLFILTGCATSGNKTAVAKSHDPKLVNSWRIHGQKSDLVKPDGYWFYDEHGGFWPVTREEYEASDLPVKR